MVVLSGLRITLVRSAFTCKARRMRIRREKAVYEEIVFNQSSYRLNRTICGSVAFKIMSPSFSTYTAHSTATVNRFTYNVVLTFESVDKILWCDHSNETSSAVLLHGIIVFQYFTK